MKESIYGWYPPANDLLTTKEPTDTYVKECLYRHRQSRYHTSPTSPINNATNSKINSTANFQPTPPPPSCNDNKKPASPAQQMTPIASDQEQQMGIDNRLFRSRQAWSTKLAETSLVGPNTLGDPGTVARQDGPRAYTRSRSAASLRPRAPIAPRSVKSARPNQRPLITSPSSEDRPRMPEERVPCTLIESRSCGQLEPSVEIRRPSAPTPAVASIREVGVENPLDYDEQLKIHGWRMEIPGDPLNLKRPCIAKRLPTYVTVEIPRIPPNPPQGHMNSFETFFYNTIPRGPMSFTIHPDWPSEILNAKRMEKQKRDGPKYLYRTTNFSFMY